MVEQELQSLYWNNVEALDCISELIAAIRVQNERMQLREIPRVTERLKISIQSMITCYNALQEAGMPWNLEYFNSILTQIEEAQCMQDWILMGDLYELLMVPALQDIQCAIQNTGISLQVSSWLTDNLQVLKDKNSDLYHALTDYNKTGISSAYSETQYSIEPAMTGCYTMALEENGRRWYLHSNCNPIGEARCIAQNTYKLEKERYLLVGWGMGYLVRELLRLYPDMDLSVVEPDLAILYHSLSYGDWRSELEQVHISWDPEWKQFQREINEERELILFRPELCHFQNETIRKQLMNIATRKDGIDYHNRIFYQNARENIRCCNHYVDELRPKMNGKRIIVVAGGPSLDRNIQWLNNKPQDVILLAVGTVYKLLLKKHIPVDYCLVSDCAIYEQIRGMENSSIPILILSTADRRVSKYYKGPKYLICQKGYEMAADYAKSHGYQCYESGGSVATLALDVAIRMGAASIAFVGLDLAFDGNRSHATGTGKETYGGFEYQKVEGIDGTMLNTSQSFVNFRTWMERRIRQSDVNMEIVDATEGGAKKEGFRIMTLQEYLKQL